MKTFRLLFSDAMARAIVRGRKTVTRRPVFDASNGSPPTGAQFYEYHRSVPAACFTVPGYMPGTHWSARLPCSPGDTIIGRECWGSGDLYYHDYETDPPGVIVYRADKSGRYADDTPLPKRDTDSFNWSMQKWRPSIHMPDWAARIRRRVVSVTVERLQDIDCDEAHREGFPTSAEDYEHNDTRAIRVFAEVWDSIYAAKGLGWEVNPWVWRIEFERENVQEVSNVR